MKNLSCLVLILFFCSCSQDQKSLANLKLDRIIGTWILVSNTISKGDTLIVKDLQGKKLIKIINQNHFAFFNHDIVNDLDSTIKKEATFVSGAGTYTFDGENYHEHLEYCNYREWENRDFDFKLTFHGDTLIQSGLEEIKELNVSQRIVEKYLPFNPQTQK